MNGRNGTSRHVFPLLLVWTCADLQEGHSILPFLTSHDDVALLCQPTGTQPTSISFLTWVTPLTLATVSWATCFWWKLDK